MTDETDLSAEHLDVYDSRGVWWNPGTEDVDLFLEQHR